MPRGDLLTILGFYASSNQSHAQFTKLPISGSLSNATSRSKRTKINGISSVSAADSTEHLLVKQVASVPTYPRMLPNWIDVSW